MRNNKSVYAMISPHDFNIQAVKKIKELSNDLGFHQSCFWLSITVASVSLVIMVNMYYSSQKLGYHSKLLKQIATDVDVIKENLS